MADYQSLINQQIEKNQSLLERLNEIQSSNAQMAGAGTSFIEKNSPVVPYLNPLSGTRSALSLGNEAMVYSKGAQEQYDTGWKILMEMLHEQEGQRQFDETLKFKEKELAQNYALEAAKTYTELNPTVNSLKAGAKTKASEYLALLTDLKTARSMLGETGGVVSDIIGGKTGPVAKLFGQRGAGGELRAYIQKLSSLVKNKTYGSALTSTEIADAQSWLPAEKMQESTNRKRLDAIIASKENEIRSLLRTEGVSEEEINAYIAQSNSSSQNLPTTGGAKPPLSSFER